MCRRRNRLRASGLVWHLWVLGFGPQVSRSLKRSAEQVRTTLLCSATAGAMFMVLCSAIKLMSISTPLDHAGFTCDVLNPRAKLVTLSPKLNRISTLAQAQGTLGYTTSLGNTYSKLNHKCPARGSQATSKGIGTIIYTGTSTYQAMT